VAQGIERPTSAHSHRQTLENLAKVAQKHLGRPLNGLGELYEEELMAAVVADDSYLDGSGAQLSRYTLRRRRVALGAYLRAVGLPGRTFEEARAIMDRGLRRAAQRRGYRYIIAAGRPESLDHYRPPLEDVARFLAVAAHWQQAYAGPRLVVAAALSLWHGLRAVSVLAIDGRDLRWHRGSLFLKKKEKAVKGKRESQEIELRPQVIACLLRYAASFNSYAAAMGRRDRIGVGVGIPGPFFRSLRDGPWTYNAMFAAYGNCCRAAGVPRFTPHGLRRLYASRMAAVLPAHESALAGNWMNEGVFLRYYARSLRSWQPKLPIGEPPVDLDAGRPEPAAVAALEAKAS
jgi:integrase